MLSHRFFKRSAPMVPCVLVGMVLLVGCQGSDSSPEPATGQAAQSPSPESVPPASPAAPAEPVTSPASTTEEAAGLQPVAPDSLPSAPVLPGLELDPAGIPIAAADALTAPVEATTVAPVGTEASPVPLPALDTPMLDPGVDSAVAPVPMPSATEPAGLAPVSPPLGESIAAPADALAPEMPAVTPPATVPETDAVAQPMLEPVAAAPIATQPVTEPVTEPVAADPIMPAVPGPIATPIEPGPNDAVAGPPAVMPPMAEPAPVAVTEPPATEPAEPFPDNPLRGGSDAAAVRPDPVPMAEPTPATDPNAAPIPVPSETAAPTDVPPSEIAAPGAPTATADVPAPSAEPAEKPFGKGKHSGEDFDPVAVNGPIFVGWGRPKAALVISGRQDGYLEPCGCAGLDRMKGGLTRRHSLFQQLEANGCPTVGLDTGGLIKGFGRQAELKFGMSSDAMQQMGYKAIALGKSDLRLPPTELLPRVASTPEAPSPYVSANVAIFDPEFTADHHILEVGGVRVGVTAILGTKWQQEISNPNIQMSDPATKLKEVLEKLQGKCDLLVLLAHATLDESVELAKAFPQFDIVVTGGGAPEPPAEVEKINDKTLLVEVGEKGMNAIVLGVFDEGIRYQRVPLDSRFPDSPEMKQYMRQYQEQLRSDGLARLGIRPSPHPRAEEQGKFVGSKKCEDCHEPSYDIWKKTGHAKAWDTLKDLEVPRDFDPECISCHVIGWHPTEYFPYESGFLSEAETPRLIDVGCESCHGPGEKHIDAEMGRDEVLQAKLRKAMTVTKEQAQKDKIHWCLNCHDLDNSPDFDFDEYWPHIEHYEDVFDDE